MNSRAQTKRCANADCTVILEDDEIDFRDGLCDECWLKKCREASE